MLTGLSKRFRFKAALALAVFYAFCTLAPSAAHAFANSATAAHGLTGQHGIASVQEHSAKAHVHVGAAGQYDAENPAYQPSEPQEKSDPGSCCGMFCVPALALAQDATLAAPVPVSLDLFAVDSRNGGRSPDRIHRPPIS